jgi:ribosomal protein S1
VKSWQDKQLRKGDYVRDIKGEFGRGYVSKLEPYGAHIEWESGLNGFLGFAWIEVLVSPKERALHPTIEKVIKILDSRE